MKESVSPDAPACTRPRHVPRMSMLPPAMICAPGLTLPQTSTELSVRISWPPRSVRLTTTISCTCGSFLRAAGEAAFCFLAAGAAGSSSGSSPIVLQIRPCSWKSFWSLANSSLRKRSRGTSTSVPRRKKPEPDSSFCSMCFQMSSKEAPSAKLSCSPFLPPLIFTISSCIMTADSPLYLTTFMTLRPLITSYRRRPG